MFVTSMIWRNLKKQALLDVCDVDDMTLFEKNKHGY